MASLYRPGPSASVSPSTMLRSLIAPVSRPLLLLSALALAACGSHMTFPVTQEGQTQANLVERNINVVMMSPDNIAQYRDPPRQSRRSFTPNPPRDPRPYTYRLGVGDQLRIQVWTNPERTQTAGATNAQDGTAGSGPIIDETGKIFYPFVGAIEAAGLTTGELRENLTERMKEFLANPQVELSVSAFRAHQVTVTGAVNSPGSVTLTNVPMRLLELVNQAGAGESADLSRISIQRNGTPYSVNLEAFISYNKRHQNPILLPGDRVHVPVLEDNKVFVFGETRTSEIGLGDERTSLTEILAQSGGIDRIRADARGVFVFRRMSPDPKDGFDVYQFNLQTAEILVLTTDFGMAPLDIVFVTNDPVTRWNDTISKLISPFAGFSRVQSAVRSVSE